MNQNANKVLQNSIVQIMILGRNQWFLIISKGRKSSLEFLFSFLNDPHHKHNNELKQIPTKFHIPYPDQVYNSCSIEAGTDSIMFRKRSRELIPQPPGLLTPRGRWGECDLVDTIAGLIRIGVIITRRLQVSAWLMQRNMLFFSQLLFLEYAWNSQLWENVYLSGINLWSTTKASMIY